MSVIDIVRLMIFLTFILLLVEGIAAIFLARYAVKIYVKRHNELAVRVDSIERRLNSLEQGNAHIGD